MEVEIEGENTEQWYFLSYSQKKKKIKKSDFNKRRKEKRSQQHHSAWKPRRFKGLW